MSKGIIQPILAFATGFAAMVVLSFVLFGLVGGESYSVTVGVSLAAVIFLICGTVLGLFWRGGSLAAGMWLVSPLALITLFSVSFAGFLYRTLTNDVPVLVMVFLAGSAGCYLGKRLAARTRAKAAHLFL